VVDEARMSPSHMVCFNAVVWVTRRACPIKNLCNVSPKGSILEQMEDRKKTKGRPANPDTPGNRPLEWI